MSAPRVSRAARWTGRGPLVLTLLLAAGLVLLAAGRTWVRGEAAGVGGPVALMVSGRQASPGVPALGVIAIAGALVCAFSGPVLRRVVAIVVGLAAAGLGVLIGATITDPQGLVRTAAARTPGTLGPPAGEQVTTAWPWVALAGAVLLLVAATAAAVARAGWERRRRYEPARRHPGGVAEGGAHGGNLPDDDPVTAWDALSRGEDPTSGRDSRSPRGG